MWKPYIRTLTTSPQTLLHGDPHIGNTYVTPDGEVGFLDWQMARRGNWSLDVGYFLQGALTVEDRRQHERALLEEYRDALAAPAAKCRPWKRFGCGIGRRWRTGWRCGWRPRVVEAGYGNAPEIAVALAQRYANAFGDLDTSIGDRRDHRLDKTHRPLVAAREKFPGLHAEEASEAPLHLDARR